MADKVLAAMSGGVDSSVAAVLLQRAGCNVTAVMMKLFKSVNAPDSDIAPESDAAAVAKKLGIPFSVCDFTAQFKSCVLERFVSEYERGRTPNPCVECNRFIKFDALFQSADALGCRHLATGHYARVERSGDRYLLKKGIDEKKDQSYMLFSLTQDKLRRVLFPLGGLTKPMVREIAHEAGLTNAGRNDSQDICFLPDGDYAAFIERFSGKTPMPGDIVDVHGNRLGEHRGIVSCTVGQRRGLGISSNGRLFVKEIDVESNTVVLGDNNSLYEDKLVATEINLIAADKIDHDLRVTAKIRYAHTGADAVVRQTGENELTVRFDTPQRAITKGQYVVLYDGDTVIGGGTINQVGEITI